MATLFVVSVPIGNLGDLTPRAHEVLSQCKVVICEELRPGETLLKRAGLVKELWPLNEHNETEKTPEYLGLIKKHGSVALISDCGTPCLSDPGTELVRLCLENGITVTPLPGACSHIIAASVSGISMKRYFYAGFPPREKEEREIFLKKVIGLGCPVILMDTPYRLRNLIECLIPLLPPRHRASLSIDLTKPTESIRSGKLSELLASLPPGKNRGEFILVVDPGNTKS